MPEAYTLFHLNSSGEPQIIANFLTTGKLPSGSFGETSPALCVFEPNLCGCAKAQNKARSVRSDQFPGAIRRFAGGPDGFFCRAFAGVNRKKDTFTQATV